MARISENSKGRLRLEFDSVGDIFRTIDEQGWKPQRDEASDRRERGNFQDFESLAEAIDTYRNHPEKIRKFDNADLKLESIESPGKDVYFDITGDYLDIGRFMDGEPEVMGNATMGNPRSIFATVNIMVSKVYYTTPGYIDRMQRRVLRLVDWLETQNIRCQIVATVVSDCINMSVIVKEFSDPVDLNDLAIVCHTDFLRRIVFLFIEQSKTFSFGYGDSISYDKKMIDYRPQPEDGMYIYVGGYIPFGGPNNGQDRLNAAFDEIEDRVFKMVEEGLTWNEEPLSIQGTTKDRW